MRAPDEKIDWVKSIPMVLMHVACLGAIWTGVSGRDVALLLVTYWARMFGITGGYHRYFAHRTYKTGRVFQFLLAFLGGTASQKGALWWAANHRHHHRYSDMPEDVHSPVQKGFWWSHMGWIVCAKYEPTRWDLIRDFAKYPELRWLNKYWAVPPTALGVATFLVGGWSGLVWGFAISTVLLWHSTFVINSLAHVFGRRRYHTTDTSRNNLALALLTMGEGWHNNHHHFQGATKNGFFWWEIDATYYVLAALRRLGLVSDFKAVPEPILRNTLAVRRAAVVEAARGRWEAALARFDAAQAAAAGRLGQAQAQMHRRVEGAQAQALRRFEAAKAEAVRKRDAAHARFDAARKDMGRRWDAAVERFEQAVDDAVATLESALHPSEGATA